MTIATLASTFSRRLSHITQLFKRANGAVHRTTTHVWVTSFVTKHVVFTAQAGNLHQHCSGYDKAAM